jgi:hypothetical protein
MSPHPSRRSLLGAALALPIAAAALPAIAAELDPDAALHTACREFMAAQAECDACDGAEHCSDDRLDAATRWHHRALGRLLTMRPRTAPGTLAMLQVAYAAMLDVSGKGCQWARAEHVGLAALAYATGQDFEPEDDA